jgi:DNA-binding FadR family transcriptional regulator
MVVSFASGMSAQLGPVLQIRKAYEQVYDQLKDMILSGRLAEGERLPNETELSERFGVSRSTIREALRLLVAENLVRTAKGGGGGSFVTLPTVAHVTGYLEQKLEVFSLTDRLSLADFLEVRELIEVFAVRSAAERATDADRAALRETLLPEGSGLSVEEQHLHNRQFHAILVEACRNDLLRLSAQPIFTVLQTHLSRSQLAADFPARVCAEHAAILEAIDAGDADLAERRMREHLRDLGRLYATIWSPTPR